MIVASLNVFLDKKVFGDDKKNINKVDFSCQITILLFDI